MREVRHLGVIILGASTYDHWHELDDPRFAASASAFRTFVARPGAVLTDGVPRILDLYNLSLSASDITGQIIDFASESEIDDLIVYYCGHGFLSNDRSSYFVSLRNTRERTRTSSSLKVRDLAQDLEEHLIGKRTFVIFDSCFAGSAAKEFMDAGGTAAVIEQHIADSFPRSGVAVIAATAGRDVALSKSEDKTTLFTGTLLSVLTDGLTAKPGLASVSWRDAVEQVRQRTIERLGHRAPKPFIAVKSDDGDITTMPFFPNTAYVAVPADGARQPEGAPIVPSRAAEPCPPAQSPVPEAVRPERPEPKGMSRWVVVAAMVAIFMVGGTGIYVLDDIYSKRFDRLQEALNRNVPPPIVATPVETATGPARAPSAVGDGDQAERQRMAAAEARQLEAERLEREKQALLARQQLAEAAAARQRAEEAESVQRVARAQAEAARKEVERQRLAAEEARKREAERVEQEKQALVKSQQLAELAAARQRAEDAERVQRAAQAEAEATRRREADEAERARLEAQRLQTERVAQANLCDQLAANPYDKNKAGNVLGVSYASVKARAKEAIAACSSAAANFPDFPRFKYQWARAVQASDPQLALALQSDLIRSNYPAAFDNYGWLMVLLQKDYAAAVAAFRRGAQLGDSDSMVSLVEMIEQQRFVPQLPQETKLELYLRAAEAGHPGAANAYQIAMKEENERVAAAAAFQGIVGAVIGGIASGVAKRH